MLRRDFNKALGAALAVLAIPLPSWASAPKVAPIVPKKLLSIGEILQVSFKPVLSSMKKGKAFVDPELNEAYYNGDITFDHLAATMEYKGKNYLVKQISVPMTWTMLDEATNSTANERIAYVKALLENAIMSHDDLLLEKYNPKKYKLTFSKTYNYDLGTINDVLGQTAKYCMLYTAFCPIKK